MRRIIVFFPVCTLAMISLIDKPVMRNINMGKSISSGGSLSMLKRYPFAVVAALILLLGVAYADVPQKRNAQSVDEFYGLWRFENIYQANSQQGVSF